MKGRSWFLSASKSTPRWAPAFSSAMSMTRRTTSSSRMSSVNICEALSKVAESIALLVVESLVELLELLELVEIVPPLELELALSVPRAIEAPARSLVRARRPSSGQRCSSWATLAKAPQC